MNSEEPLIEHETIREPVNKLMIKMRNRSVKRPKCRSKFIVMASVTSALLLFVRFLLFIDFSSEEDGKMYGGESK